MSDLLTYFLGLSCVCHVVTIAWMSSSVNVSRADEAVNDSRASSCSSSSAGGRLHRRATSRGAMTSSCSHVTSASTRHHDNAQQQQQPTTTTTSLVHHHTHCIIPGTLGFQSTQARRAILLKPFDALCCHMGTAIKHHVLYWVKPSFVIFDIWSL